VLEFRLAHSVGEARVCLSAANLRIDDVVVSDVVAVRAARFGREIRRGVNGADPEPFVAIYTAVTGAPEPSKGSWPGGVAVN